MLLLPHHHHSWFLSAGVALFPLVLSFFRARSGSPRLTRTNLNLNGTLALFKDRLRIIDLNNLLIGDTVFGRTPR